MSFPELETAINRLQGGVGNESAQKLAHTYCREFIHTYHKDPIQFFKIFATTASEQTQFWSLTALQTLLSDYYGAYDLNDKKNMHTSFIELLKGGMQIISKKKYLMQKLAFLYLIMVKHDYPEIDSTLLAQLFDIQEQEPDQLVKANYIGIYIDIYIYWYILYIYII